jgi:hypothetical protein
MVNKVIPTNMPHPMSVVGWDGTDFHILTIDPAGHLQVDLVSGALPTGAATAANQLTEITALQLIDDLRAALHSVNTDELQVNVEDSVLPTGAATSANQATEITDLESIMPYDRGAGKVYTFYSGALAAHAQAIRATYTVPAGHHAIIEAFYATCDLPDATKEAFIKLWVGTYSAIVLAVENGNTLKSSRSLNWSGAILLPTGTVVNILTYSTALINLTFTASILINEFNI